MKVHVLPAENGVYSFGDDDGPNEFDSDDAVEVEDDRKEENWHGVRVAVHRPETEHLTGAPLAATETNIKLFSSMVRNGICCIICL